MAAEVVVTHGEQTEGVRDQCPVKVCKDVMVASVTRLLNGSTSGLLRRHYVAVPSSRLCLPKRSCMSHIVVSGGHPPTILHGVRALCGAKHLTNAKCLSVLPISRNIRRSTKTSFTTGPLCFSPGGVIRLTVRTNYGYITSACNILTSMSQHCTRHVPFLIGLGRGRALDCPGACSRALCTDIRRTFGVNTITINTAVCFNSRRSHHRVRRVSTTFRHTRRLNVIAIL